MATSLETLMSIVLVGGISTTGLAAVSEINDQVQSVAYSAQIEAAADCADRVFLLHGLDPVQGVQKVLNYENTEVNRELLNCMTPITGVTGEQLLQTPTDIYALKKEL